MRVLRQVLHISMNNEIRQLTTELSNLAIRRSETIAELKSLDDRETKIRHDLKIIKKAISANSLSCRDSKGTKLREGDKVTTLTRGKFHKQIAKAIQVNPDNHVDIQYLVSRKETWRLGKNLLILSNHANSRD